MSNQKITIEEALEPVFNRGMSFSEQRQLLNKMFAISVANAPDDESDNFTARQLQPFFLAMSQLIDNLEKFDC